jgi:hypothetical protein
MWLFVFIVATFFYLYITIGFRLLDTYQACGEQRGCSPFVGKIQAAGLEIFPSKSIRISPAPHVSHWQASKNRC